MGALMKQAQEAMERAKTFEKELALEEVEVEREGVKVKFNGMGELLSLKVDSALVNPEDIEPLEDCLLLALREGHSKAMDIRKEKLSQITGDLPIPPGLGL